MRRRSLALTRPAGPKRSPAALAAPFVLALASLGVLGSCTGSRPTLGTADAKRTTTSSSTTSTPKGPTSTTTSPRKADTLGPDTLLGYIATPNAAPVVRAEPRDDSPPVDIAAKTPAGAPMTFAIVGDPTTADGWYQVALPTRPNASSAWVPASSVTVTKTPFRIFVDLGARALRVEKDGKEVLASPTAIGTPENPTPVGSTYVTELIDNVNPGGAYGPYAFGLALHSDTLSEFGGGDGQVGIHGTNQPQLMGQAVSHGCVRLRNADVERLVDLELPLGVPVFIT